MLGLLITGFIRLFVYGIAVQKRVGADVYLEYLLSFKFQVYSKQ